MTLPTNRPSTVENTIQPPRKKSRSLSIQHLAFEPCKNRGHKERGRMAEIVRIF
jgi:hypothetical protein